jgi:1-acyl-sn-glycerol-3-phosphate acyltransferase
MTPIAGESKWGYYTGRVWGRIMCALALTRIKINGNENINPNQSYIFVANHQSMFDIFLVYGYLNAKFKWIMKQEIRKTPLLGKACESMGHIFIDRSNPMRAQKSLQEAQERLLQGHNSIFLFPEGTRSANGKVGRFKRGAFTIARDLHFPIVPITITGAYEALPKGPNYIIPGTIKMTIHKPIDTTHLTDENINETIDQVRNTIVNVMK